MNSKYPALVETNNEPEYEQKPYLPISSVGTDYRTADETNLPCGSALLTDTLDGKGNGSSTLNSNGITHIIHAAPKPRSSFTSDQEFINNIVKSVQNSIILADRPDIQEQIKIDTLAIPLVGGELYLGTCNPQDLAEGIILGAINQLKKSDNLAFITLIDWKGSPQHHFLKKILQIKDESNELFDSFTYDEAKKQFIGDLKKSLRKIYVEVGDIKDKKLHQSPVIVNAANTYVGFGGGISGAIKVETVNNGAGIDLKAKELIGKFYSLIPEEYKKKESDNGRENDNSTKINFLIKYAGPGQVPGSYGFWKVDSNGEIERGSSGYQILINIIKEHPVLKNPPFFWRRMVDESKQIYATSKITVKAEDKDKEFFEENDFLEIEEIKKGIPNQNNQNDDKDNKTASEWQEELKEIDNDLEQVFNEDKVEEWKEKGKGGFGKAENVKKLIKSVKDNAKFLNLIKTKHGSDSLSDLFTYKNPQEVITIVKRFEYDNLSPGEKENKNKKIKKHYGLGENDVLSDDQITDYCYKVATGEITESSTNDQTPNTSNPENNILKYLGIGALILIPLSLVLIFFIKKRNRTEEE